MAEPKVLVLRAAGTNCDEETRFAFESQGASAQTLHINRVLEKPTLLGDYGLLAIPGGFSYGDHIAAGKVFAVEVGVALGDHLREFIARGGLILGICNGFQVLVKTGILPGARKQGPTQAATIAWNDSNRYEDRWVDLAVDGQRCLMAPTHLEKISLPVGHAEGRFTVSEPGMIEELVAEHQAVFRYLGSEGKPARYPENPNGSMGDIAGICDQSGQVLGLMPHPDRALFCWQHPRWHRDGKPEVGDGCSLFKAAVDALR